MRFAFLFFPVLLACSSLYAGSDTLNPELGVVYRPPSVRWDAQQWNAIFSDPAPPMGWAVLPVGKEGCAAVNKSWLAAAKGKGLNLAILFTPFLQPSDFTRTIDCAVPLGFQRAVMDEYISYQTRNNGRPLCTVLSEVRSIYETVKRRHPGFELGINDTWHTWMVDLARGQNDGCGGYPQFRYDLTGISVLSKYGNPAENTCDHPTAREMQEQIIDLKPTVKDHSRTGKIFVWQLNQNWYPGGEKVLQLYRMMKPIYGWDRFPLFGPTTEHPTEENWGYNTRSGPQQCGSAGYEWYLPARKYLQRIVEGAQTVMNIQAPPPSSPGQTVNVSGRLKGTGGTSNIVEVQLVPPPDSPQTFEMQITAPGGSLFALVGVRVNTQLPNPIRADADFTVQRIRLFATNTTKQLVPNSDFDDGLRGWIAAGPTQVVTVDGDKSVSFQAAANQSISLTSLLPIPVVPGRSYTLQVDARILQESRNGAYFFISWHRPSEIRKDRAFVSFPGRQTIATGATRADGTFHAAFISPDNGVYSLFAFFRGTRALQPSIASTTLIVN